MGKYLDTLIERESVLNEVSENRTSLNTREGIFVDIPTSTNPQKVQKVEISTDIPTLRRPQKVQKGAATEKFHNDILSVAPLRPAPALALG